MKTLSKGKMWCFAIGQFGWSLLSALITNWLVYFYQPDADSIAAGQTLFIPQGRVILGIATVIGGIAALGRVFDAVTDPMIANLSDRSQNPKGRRIPFMQKIAIPFALITVLVFWAPVNAISTVNCVWLLVTLLLFYLFMTTYCTPYNRHLPSGIRDRLCGAFYLGRDGALPGESDGHPRHLCDSGGNRPGRAFGADLHDQ